MKCFTGQTADIVWQKAAAELIARPDCAHSGRNGVTREIIPCVLQIQNPSQRWILSRRPPYNPAFGLVEFIWIITGNNESGVLNYWNPELPKFSGAGDEYHGAYGFRLRREFGLDQIKRAYDVLSNAPDTRQAVLQIWKPEIDMPTGEGKPVSPDIPCNVMSLLKVRDGRLHWTQIMRSNDIMRGLPYNIIQFTMLQEVMAGWLGCDLGEYFHLSDSLHVYERDAKTFYIELTKPPSVTRDALSLSYDATHDLFHSLYEDLRQVSGGGHNEAYLRETFDRDSPKNRSRCALVRDMMAVIGSDAARRQGYLMLAHGLVESCMDAELRLAATNWLYHKEGKNDYQEHQECLHQSPPPG